MLHAGIWLVACFIWANGLAADDVFDEAAPANEAAATASAEDLATPDPLGEAASASVEEDRGDAVPKGDAPAAVPEETESESAPQPARSTPASQVEQSPDGIFSGRAGRLPSDAEQYSVWDPYGVSSWWLEPAAPELDPYRPDFLAPTGLIADHLVPTGNQVLFSYRYHRTAYDGLRDGTSDLSTADVLANYTLAPLRGVSERHLLLLEYSPIENLTILGQLPILQNSIDFQNAAGETIHSTMTDPGDTSLTGVFGIARWEGHQLLGSFGLSLPTGVFDKNSEAAFPSALNVTYPLRTSSGTWDLLPGLTYRGENARWSWGGQAQAIVRTGMNARDYRLGDQVQLTGWVARRWTPCWSTSFRMTGTLADSIHHENGRLDPTLTPTNRSGNFGGQRLDLFLGANYFLKPEAWPNQYLSLEAGLPAYQSLNGPQLKTDWMLSFGWNLMF